MQTIEIDDIIIGERTREPKDEDIRKLAADIKEKGLLQPIILTSHDEPQLVAGMHRVTAIQFLHEAAMDRGYIGEYIHDQEPVDTTHIPYVVVGELTPRQMIEYELAENLVRVELPWQDRARALARIQKLLGEEAKPATPMQVATHLTASGDKRGTPAQLNEITRTAIVADNLDDPDVAKAKTLSEAWTVVRKKATALHQAVLANAIDAEAEAQAESPHRLYNADMVEWLMAYDGEPFDLIIADPPYGSGADSWKSKFIDAPHNYKDDFATAKRLHNCLFYEGFRICKEQANFFLFCDPKHWSYWETTARLAGWATWPRPLIWKKSGEGIRPWGTAGFAYTYETILYATKGRKGLLQSVNDVIDIYKITSGRLHGAQKPEALFAHLMEISTLPGGTVLDPTCGSGTIFPAASSSRLIATGLELNPEYYATAEERRRSSAVALARTAIAEDLPDDLLDDDLL